MRLHDLSLATRVTIGALAMVVAGTVTLLFFESARLHDAYLSDRRSHLGLDIETGTLRLNQAINTLRQDVLFLSNTPPVSGIVRATLNRGYDPRYGNTNKVWEERLQQIFSAFSIAHPVYYRIRYIGVADGGREIVRIENRGGRIEITPPKELQSKGDLDYFKATLGLREGQVSLSEFNPGREDGVIGQRPHPALRAATPVFTPSGEMFGMAVIDMDVGGLLKSTVSDLPGVQTYLANENGQYLLHPDLQQTFKVDTGGRNGGKNDIATDFPFIKTMFNPQAPDYLPLQAATSEAGNPLFVAKRIYFDQGNPSRFLLLMYYLPGAVVAKQVDTIPVNTILSAFMVMLLVGIIAVLALRRTFSPLKQIAAAADKIAVGDQDSLLLPAGGGEIGSLTGALNAMLFKLSQREKLLRESEARYRRLHESMVDAYAMVDMSGRLLESNHTFRDMLGYSDEELKRMTYADLTPEKWHEFEMRIIRGQVIPDGYSQVYEKEYIRKDGTVFPVELKTFLLRDVNNQPDAMWAIVRDITERKRVEEELNRFFSLVPDLVCIASAEGRFLKINSAWQKMLGYTEREILATPFLDLIHPDDRDATMTEVKRQLDGEPTIEFINRYQCKDGSYRWLEWRASPAVDKKLLFASARDITGRKQADDKLRLHSEILGNLSEGVFLIRASDGMIVFANPQLEGMFGYEPGELLGKHVSVVNAPGGKTPDAIAAEIMGELERTGEWSGELRNIRKSGTTFWCHASVSAFEHSEFGKVWVSVHEDITERMQTELLVQQFGSLLQGSFNEIYMFDADSLHFILTSEGAEKNLGYSSDELNELTPLDIEPSFTRESFEQLVSPLRNGSKSLLHFEAVHRRKDGTTYPVEVNLQLMSTTFLAVVRDITERNQAEIKLRKFAEKIEDLYNNAPCGYHSLDKNGSILMINDTELAWLGYTQDEVIGKIKWTDLLTPAGVKVFQETFPQFMKQGFIHDIDLELIRKDGTVLSGLISATAIYDQDGNFVMSRSTVTDIAERKRAEEMLREHQIEIELQNDELQRTQVYLDIARARYFDLYNLAPMGYFTISETWLIMESNITAATLLGVDRVALTERKLSQFTIREDQDVFYLFRKQLVKSSESQACELRMMKSDGTQFWAHLAGVTAQDENGAPIFRIVMSDITERKRIERRLHDLAAHLQSVREEEKAGIAREIHDDMGGTLTALKIETYWLKTELSACDDTVPLLNRIEGMSQLIDNAMGVMRGIVTGLRPTILDDLGLLAALEWQAAQFHKHTGIECRVNCVCATDEECATELDKARSIALFRIVQEALNNVAKHSGASRVEIEFHQSDEEVVMSIIDNGRGMAEKRPKTLKPDVSIPYGILGMCERADQLGGKISFDTPPGGGVCVTVILPLLENDEETA